MRTYDYVVFVARCQPPHKIHIKIITKALEIASRKVLIVLGSHRAAPDIRNPWTCEQREQMILRCFQPADQERIEFLRVADHHYNDSVWVAEVQHKVKRSLHDPIDNSIAYIGHYKDHTSYYLDLFPRWHFIDAGLFVRETMAATTIRESYFGTPPTKPSESWTDKPVNDWRGLVERPVEQYLDEFAQTNEYKYLAKEYQHIVSYKASWASTPYPVTFVTTDCVVTKAGHVLLVIRKVNPGKGLYALPGGFLSPNQTLLESALRELKEETDIKTPFNELRQYVVGSRPFDFPERSMRGRTVTFAFHFKLPDGGDLPTVKGCDDAAEAVWIPIGELHGISDKFYEDHLHIIEHFIFRS